MSTFTEQQEHRDHLARWDDRGVGDPCRRWTTCDRCGTESPELTFYTEVDRWEWDHQGPFDCPAPAPERVWDDAFEQFPPLPEWGFTRRIEPAGDIPAPGRSFDPIPFTPRPNKPVIYTDLPADVERGAA